MKPTISIITIALNADKHIEQTIQSVLNQTYKNKEYIIVDGDSTDRTLDMINKYRSRIDAFVSEKDEGIADAMNKGVAFMSGDYVIFLHADDYFNNDSSVENAVECLDETTDILACGIQFGEQKRILKPIGFNFWFNFKQGLFHQGVICRRSVIEKLLGFDKQFRIAMDYDFFLRAYRSRYQLIKAPVILSVMRDTGISSRRDWKNLRMRFAEERKVHEKNCPSFSMSLLYKLYWFLSSLQTDNLHGEKCEFSSSVNGNI